MTVESKPQVTPVVAFVVVSLATAGYFTGLQAPMNPTRTTSKRSDPVHRETSRGAESNVAAATDYADMHTLTAQSGSGTVLTGLRSEIAPLAEIRIDPADKLTALQRREGNRAFNGAPPTIPHPIDQRTSTACVACHGEGAKTASLRVPRMSHPFLTNCLQCHVENNPAQKLAALFRENSFTGLEAPKEGPRAFAGAPPQIPHATWMRSDCMSCHGSSGLHGIRTTHPWRRNCQQCHAPSASSDQTFPAAQSTFLPGPKIAE